MSVESVELSRREIADEHGEKKEMDPDNCRWTDSTKNIYRRKGDKNGEGATCRKRGGPGCCLDNPWNKTCTWDSNYTSSPAKCLWDEKITL